MYPPLASRCIVAQACGLSDWDTLLDAVLTARQQIALAWASVFDQFLEMTA
jgi:glutamate-ammonia-ligase adenylyltransferase